VESSAEEIWALYESVAFLNYFNDLPDVRRDRLKIGGGRAKGVFFASVL
jgi:hypothetical protein